MGYLKNYGIFLFLLMSFFDHLNGQCIDVVIEDPSFESGDFNYDGGWERDDGAEFVTFPTVDGIYSIYSNGGGVYQQIKVLPNTNYYLSCWVKNGLYDFYLQIGFTDFEDTIIDTGLVDTDEWDFITKPFSTNSEDTIATIRYWSNAAYVDLFQVTCEPLTSISTSRQPKNVNCFPNPSQETSTIIIEDIGDRKLTLKLYDVKGKIVRYLPNITGPKVTLERKNLPNGIYFYQLKSDDKIYANGKWILE